MAPNLALSGLPKGRSLAHRRQRAMWHDMDTLRRDPKSMTEFRSRVNIVADERIGHAVQLRIQRLVKRQVCMG